MLTPDEFRDRIETFLAQSNTPPTRLGIDAVRDPNFVADIRNGRVPSLTLASKVLEFIEANSVSSEGAQA